MQKNTESPLKACNICTTLSLQGNNSTVLLHIGQQQTSITFCAQLTEPDEQITLALGAQKTATDFFKHTPPTPLEVETAINTIEDEISPLSKKINPSTALITEDYAIKQIALLADVTDEAEMVLSLDKLETLFNRWADVVSGRPVSRENLPDDLQFATVLLILREFMHHLHFEQICIVSKVQVI